MQKLTLLLAFLLFLLPVYSIGEHEAINGTTVATTHGRYSGNYSGISTVLTGLYSSQDGMIIPYDYDFDGDIDLIRQKTVTPGCNTSGRCYAAYRNNGDGTHTWVHLAEVGEDCQALPQFANINRRDDSAKDMIVNCGSRGVYYSDGWNGGGFGTGFNYANIICDNGGIGAGASEPITFGDLNNDGYDDYICTRVRSSSQDYFDYIVGINTAGGNNPTWSTNVYTVYYPVGKRPRSAGVVAHIVDFNNDGCNDIVFTQSYVDGAHQPNGWYYRGNCAGIFTADGTAQLGDHYYGVNTQVGAGTGKINGDNSGWVYQRNNQNNGNLQIFLDKTLVNTLGSGLGCHDILRADHIEEGSGQPWLYFSGTYASQGNRNGNCEIDRSVTQKIKMIDGYYPNSVTRTIVSTTETDRFSYTFQEKDKNSWKSGNYIRIPYSGEKWNQKANYPYNVFGAAAASVDGKVYIFGGRETPSGTVINDVYEYDPAFNSYAWKNNINGGGRAYATATVVSGKIYLIGGINGNGVMSRVDMYDPSSNSWTPKASMSVNRHRHTAAVVNGNIYVVGGDTGGSRTRRVDMYNPTLNTWVQKNDFPAPISDHMAATVNGKMYVVGGHFNNVAGDNWRTYEYDNVLDSWTRKADLPRDTTNAGAFELNGRMYIVGGRGYVGGYITMKNNVEEYNPSTDTWKARSSLPVARESSAVASVGNKTYIIGGYNSGEYTYYNRNDEYDLSFVAWKVNSVTRSSPSSLTYTEVSSVDQIIDGKYYNDKGGKLLLVGVPDRIPPGTTYTITANHNIAPDHSGGSYEIPISNSPRLGGQWYTYDQGSGLSSSGCRYSVTDSTGTVTRVPWQNCPQQPTNGQTTNWAPTFSVNTTGLEPGTNNKLHFKIKNVAGYESQFNNIYTINFDDIVPTTSHNYDNNWKSTDTPVTLTCSDIYPGCSYTTYCISSDMSDCTPNTNLTYTSGSSGSFSVTCPSATTCQKKVRYYSRDLAGNQETTQSITVKIDKQGPTTTYSISPSSPTGLNGWYNSSPTVTLSCSDPGNGSGCWNIKYCVDISNSCNPNLGTIYTSPFTVTQQGNHTHIRFRSLDNVNNQESVQNRSIDLDTSSPTVYNSPIVELLTANSQKIRAPNAVDNLAGVTLYRFKKINDGSTYDSGNDVMEATGLTENTQYNWSVQLRDNAGNWNTYGTVTSKYTNVSGPSTITFDNIQSTSLRLIATTFTNYSSGQSGYYFECYGGQVNGCSNSGWIKTNQYTDSGLVPNTRYNYREKNRNGDGVETAYSSNISTYTKANDPSFDITNTNSTNYTILINQNGNPSYTKYTLSINNGTEYYINSQGYPISTIGNNPTWQTYAQWQSYSNFIIKNLRPNTNYVIKLKARNENQIETNEAVKSKYTLANPVSNLDISPWTQIRDSEFHIDPNNIISNLENLFPALDGVIYDIRRVNSYAVDEIGPGIDFEYGFEENSLLPFVTAAPFEWSIDSSVSKTGSYSAKASDVLGGQRSALSLVTNTNIPVSVAFDFKTSTETNDYLVLYIDGLEYARWSGERDWEHVFFYALPTGYHVFTWVYEKDFSGSSGADSVWIDNVKVYAFRD